jgi:hypothetical protein
MSDAVDATTLDDVDNINDVAREAALSAREAALNRRVRGRGEGAES